jgi:segregation and condensation protein B
MSKKINKEIKNVIEAALMVARQPLSIDKLVALFPEAEKKSVEEADKKSATIRDEIKAALDVLIDEYQDRGIELKKINKKYRLQSKTDYSEWLSRLTEEKPPRYSRAALETLAIIAYRQPVTRGDIEDIRGVTVSSDIIRNLVDREWIRQVGQRDVPGKPSLYGTTQEFLEYFSLAGLNDLPTLAELRDLEEIGKELNLSLNLESKTNSKSSEINSEGADEDPENLDDSEMKNISSEENSIDVENEAEVVHPIEAKASQLNQ